MNRYAIYIHTKDGTKTVRYIINSMSKMEAVMNANEFVNKHPERFSQDDINVVRLGRVRTNKRERYVNGE